VPQSALHHRLSLSTSFFPTCHTSFPIRAAARCSGLDLAGPRVAATWSSSLARSRRSGAARRMGRSGPELAGPACPPAGSRRSGVARRACRDGPELAGPSVPADRVTTAWSSPSGVSWRPGARRPERACPGRGGVEQPAGRVATWSSLAGSRHLLLRHRLLCSGPPAIASSAPARPPSPHLLAGGVDPARWPTSAARRPPSVRCDVRQQGAAARGSPVEFHRRARARQAPAGSGSAGRGEHRTAVEPVCARDLEKRSSFFPMRFLSFLRASFLV
jgi:hypothetical protein